MNEFNYVKNIAVRFGDLDTLGHVNNVAYVKYLEEARRGYYDDVVGVPFETLHTVIAMLQIEYHSEITPNQSVDVGVRVPQLGDSSVPMEYEIRTTGSNSGKTTIAATAETIQVNTDPETGEAATIPVDWRTAISNYEDL
ncbi:acyl-CoA thioesterase [Haladaptatus halobius]|uniref:acyl-CoA thioesterase n=1 Tax=Haladaptatus halobius TaxID=2884875 RepID=UPI001D0B32C8|nr:thioesterase family protein [Haladaptatus halobius]